jgi:uncharacterized protein
MPRKHSCGTLEMQFCSRKFCPNPASSAPRIELGMEELEAVRLKDMEGKEQTDCAAIMNLSRPTFQRVLYAAREKIARALVEGRELCIKGGNYIPKKRLFKCLDCDAAWEPEPCLGGADNGCFCSCPRCGSMNKARLTEDGRVRPCCLGQDIEQDQLQEKIKCNQQFPVDRFSERQVLLIGGDVIQYCRK